MKPQENIVLTLDNVELFSHSLIVSGWTISDSGIERIEVYLNDVLIGNAEYGCCRPDVERIYPDIKKSLYSGFGLSSPVEILKEQINEYTLLIRAINRRGQSLERMLWVIKKSCDPFLKSAISSFSLSSTSVFPPITSPDFVQRKTDLIIDHNSGGGANHYRVQYIRRKIEQGENVFLLLPSRSNNSHYELYYYQNHGTTYLLFTFDEILDLCNSANIQEICVNNLVSYPEPLEILSIIKCIKKTYDYEILIPIHDYFSICPSFHLLNDRGEYCGIPDIEECKRCITNNELQYIRNRYDHIENWRKEWGKFFEFSDRIICFSNSSKAIMRKVYPFISEDKCKVIPPIVDYIQPAAMTKSHVEAFHIGVPGTIHFPKGSKIIKSLIESIEQKKLRNIKIIIIGQMIDEKITSPHLIITGKYDRAKLVNLVKKYQIDVVFVPSICPETFSYVTEEVIQMNLPVVVFDIGAPPERVKNYSKGLIIEKVNPEVVLEKMLNWFKMQP
jgi:glycosyltransferase involved in cell wall biosynthesis